MDKIELGRLTSEFRLSGLRGDYNSFASQYAEAAKIADKLRSDKKSAADACFDLLRFDIETANVPGVLEDIAHEEMANSEFAGQAIRIKQFVKTHEDLLAKTHECILSLGKRTSPEVAEDLCVGTWFRLLLLPEEYASSRDIWLLTTEAALAVAAAHGKSAFLLPDYIEPLIVRHGSRFLSFHTTGINPGVFHFKPSDFPRRVIVDAGGYSGWSSLANAKIEELEVPDAETVESFFQSHKDHVIQQNISKYSQRSKGKISELPNDFIFVALQVSTDRTQALARVPMLEMLEMVVRRFQGTETTVVVKRHPKCSDAAVSACLEALSSQRKIIVTDQGIHELLPRSRGICTVNSGVGSESIIYLKPIYLFGEADYNSVSYKISNFDDFASATETWRPFGTPVEMKKFLYYYRNDYQTPVDDTMLLQSKLTRSFFS